MKQKLLMTGATGLVGSRFVEMFGDNYDIANMDLTTGVNITEKATIQEFVNNNKADCLIHLAAFTNTQEAYKQQGDKSGVCYQVNVVGTRNMAEVCKESGIHLIHISTDYVFDGKKETPYKEEDETNPLEWYGQTKAMAEEEVKSSGVSYTLARISYPYRANFEAKPDIVKKVLTGLREGTLYPQFTDTIMTPTFTDDIARGFHAAVQAKPQGIYHFTGSTSLSPYDFAVEVAKAFGLDSSLVKKGSLVEYLKNNPRPFARYVAMDNSKATKDLQISFMTLEEGLKALSSQQS